MRYKYRKASKKCSTKNRLLKNVNVYAIYYRKKEKNQPITARYGRIKQDIQNHVNLSLYLLTTNLAKFLSLVKQHYDINFTTLQCSEKPIYQRVSKITVVNETYPVTHSVVPISVFWYFPLNLRILRRYAATEHVAEVV